jgi:hypothetical protein
MTYSGDAAEQVVRIGLEGVEVVLKITGTAAKELAVFLVAALKSKSSGLKLKGKARLADMLKSENPLEIFSIKDSDLATFARGAKQYGIVYCALRDKKHDKDGQCDILVKADDAPKISRLVERFKFATVDKAKIESEIVRSKEGKTKSAEPEAAAGPEAPDKNETEKLLDDLLGTPEGKTAPDSPEKSVAAPDKAAAKEAPAKRDPEAARTEKSLQSAPISESRPDSAKGTSNKKPSVKKALREIGAAQKKQEAQAQKRDDRQAPDKRRANVPAAHRQPQSRGRSRSKKTKERN